MRPSPVVPLLALSALLLAGGCSKKDGAAPGGPGGAMPPPEVGVVTLQPGTVPVQRDLVGRLAAYRSADVRARVPGVVQRRVYDEGSDVARGQVLFLIDPAPLRAALGQSQASLAQAQATYANAQAVADRVRKLLPQKFISQADYDNAIAAERSAAAAVQAARATVQSSSINLGYATVRAPVSGRAGKAQVTEGALVGEGGATLLTTVEQIDPLYANFSISVAERTEIQQLAQGGGSAGREVQVVLADGSVYPHAGVLDFSGDMVDPATGAIALRAVVPNPEHTLLPGTFVTLKATLGEQRAAYLVPQDAVQRDQQGAYVLAVGSDGKVLRKNIDAEHNQGANWIVTTGVAPGDKVIVSGIQRAQPGQPVKAVPWTPEAAPGAKPAAAPAAKPQG
jgi:membrane fusion protein (multidrug efflux system)